MFAKSRQWLQSHPLLSAAMTGGAAGSMFCMLFVHHIFLIDKLQLRMSSVLS